MSRTGYRYSLEIYGKDGKPVAQAPVSVDFEPAREWARFTAMRRNRLSPGATCADATVSPLWHEKAGEPYVRGFRVELLSESGSPVGTDFTIDYFRKLARKASTALVEKGLLAAGDRFRYLTTAYPEPAGVSGDRPRFVTREIEPPWRIRESALASFLECSAPREGAADEIPVFLPRRVLDEAKELAAGAGTVETGGILIGHLHRDSSEPELFVEVTAQVPAAHTRAGTNSLEFTPETWTAVQGVLDLRRDSELMVGWWHSHPVREWCKSCPIERQRVCRMARDFLSEHDRHLHRTVFPRAYSIALVMNDVAFRDMTHSLFGWKAGRLENRGYHLVTQARTPAAPHPRASQGDADAQKRATRA